MKRIEKILLTYDIINQWETKGGLLAVKHNRISSVFPKGIDFLGPRGGIKGQQLIRPDGSKTKIDWLI